MGGAKTRMLACVYASPYGPIGYAWDGRCCHAVRPGVREGIRPPCPDPVAAWLDAYFRGEAWPLPPLAPASTPFQARLRQALLAIPVGATRTYGELAQALGSSPRAVGQALAANPLPILIPCHRIVAKHGLGGFACGRVWKRHLLRFEARITQKGGPNEPPSAWE